MTWRIELAESEKHLTIATILQAQAIWKRLSKPAQDAVVDAYPNGFVRGHQNTLASLRRHGFVDGFTDRDLELTEAGKAIARWNVEKQP